MDQKKSKKVIKLLRTGNNDVPITEFSLRKMVQYAIICIIAKRGSGKSWVVRSILHHYQDVPVGTIICPTDSVNGFYKNFFPDLYIHYEYDTNFIDEIIQRQRRMIKKYDKYLLMKKVVDPRAFIIMDDCLADDKVWANDKNIKQLFLNGRHFKIMFILTMQAVLGIKPALRDNIDYIFLLKNNKITEQQKIWKHYAGIFPTFKAFSQVFNELTKDFGVMVIDNRIAGDFIDTVFWFKAERVERMHIGCRQFNRAHDKNYDPEWEDREKPVDVIDAMNKKQFKVSINKKKNTKESTG
jgi:hypothetical protein